MVCIAGDKLCTTQRVDRGKGLGFKHEAMNDRARDRANEAKGRLTCSGR